MNKNDQAEHLRHWQLQMRPLMIWMLIGLTVFFFFATAAQLWYLNENIKDTTRLPTQDVMRPFSCEPGRSNDECLDQRRFDTAALLEADTVARRYHQSNVILFSSIWSRYLGFITGMALAMVGAAFILGRIEIEPSEAGGEAGGWKVSLKTASPGLVLCTLGTVLMVVAIAILHEFHSRDESVYVSGGLPKLDHLRAPAAASATASNPLRR